MGFAKGALKTGAYLAAASLIFTAGYYARSEQVLMTEVEKQYNMEEYKKELLSKPMRYKNHILDITVFGNREFSIDVLVREMKAGKEYVKRKYDELR